MNKPLVDRIPFAKILIGLVVIFLISLGMCGLGALSLGHGGRAPSGGGMPEKALVIGIVCMVVSVVGVPLTAVVWVVMTVASRMMHKDSEPQ
jgi:predicted metal-binding membrane protein